MFKNSRTDNSSRTNVPKLVPARTDQLTCLRDSSTGLDLVTTVRKVEKRIRVKVIDEVGLKTRFCAVSSDPNR